MTRTPPLDLILVDDNPVLVRILSEILRECGHTVRSASDGFSALKEVRTRKPDILISDLSMPGMSGYELLSIVRRRFPLIHVIAMSGAFSGISVPQGVAADRFYAKGTSSVSDLLLIISTIWRDDTYAGRSPAPIWIPQPNVDHLGSSVLFVSCPECLRPFSQRASGPEFLPQKGNCPHCTTVVELALVRESNRTDGTPISADSRGSGFEEVAMSASPSESTPTEKLHQR